MPNDINFQQKSSHYVHDFAYFLTFSVKKYHEIIIILGLKNHLQNLVMR